MTLEKKVPLSSVSLGKKKGPLDQLGRRAWGLMVAAVPYVPFVWRDSATGTCIPGVQ